MGYNNPKKAKGIPYFTDSHPTSADIDQPYDVWVDFDNKKVVMIWDDPYAAEDNDRVARSILTYIQNEYPTNPEYGDIWIKPNATVSAGVPKIYRLPPYGWQYITLGAIISAAPPPPVGVFAWEYKLGEPTKTQPSEDTYDALWQQGVIPGTPSAGGFMATVDTTYPFVHIWDTSDWTKLANPSPLPAAGTKGLAWNSDHTRMAITLGGATTTLYVYETATWTQVNTFGDTQSTSDSWCCEYSPDDILLLQGINQSPWVHIWNTTTWTLQSLIAGGDIPNGRTESISFTTDGSLCALGTANAPFVHIYATSGSPYWTEITTGISLTDHVHGVAFSNDGTMLGTGDNDGNFKVFTVNIGGTWPVVNAESYGFNNKVADISWNPDDSIVAVAHRSSPYMTAYNTSTWIALTSPGGIDSDGTGISFNWDGSLCAVVSNGTYSTWIYATSASPWTQWAWFNYPVSVDADIADIHFTGTPEAGNPSAGTGNFLIPSAGSFTDPDFALEPYWDTFGTSGMVLKQY